MTTTRKSSSNNNIQVSKLSLTWQNRREKKKIVHRFLLPSYYRRRDICISGWKEKYVCKRLVL
jgi:hypothetical protein